MKNGNKHLLKNNIMFLGKKVQKDLTVALLIKTTQKVSIIVRPAMHFCLKASINLTAVLAGLALTEKFQVR